MNKKHIALIIILVVVAGGFYFFKSTKMLVVTKDYPASSNYDFYSISNFKSKNLSPGLYDTEGYVVKKYECPPCSADEQCKPCMGNNIVISEKNIPLEAYNLSGTEMIIFVDNSQGFEVGKKYKFSIRLSEIRTTDEPVNNIELVGFNSISI